MEDKIRKEVCGSKIGSYCTWKAEGKLAGPELLPLGSVTAQVC